MLSIADFNSLTYKLVWQVCVGQQLSLQVTLQRDRGHGRGQSAGEDRGRVDNPRSWGGGITWAEVARDKLTDWTTLNGGEEKQL